MKTLELRCPSCRRELEVDVGFAGGVCRCSHCGALMSVPRRSSGQAEAVSRAERPDRPDVSSPSARPEAPAGAQGAETKGDGDTEVALEPSESQSPGTPETGEAEGDDDDPLAALAAGGSNEAPAEPAGGDDQPPATYTTSSGQQIDVGDDRAIPTARKKTVLKRRVMVYGIVGAITLGMTAMVIFAAVTILQGEGEPTRAEQFQPTREFNYNRGANPFTHQHVNALGLPFSKGETVVLVDASAASNDWLSWVKSALAYGLTREDSEATFELMFANGDSTRAMNGYALVEAAKTDRSDVADFQSSVPADGQADLTTAFESAASLQPDQIVLITGRGLDSSKLKDIRGALDSLESVMVDVVYIKKKPDAMFEPDPPPVADLQRYSRGGHFRWLEPAQLESWYEQSR